MSSLVLFDEIGTGTDPVQGAALAQAVLEELLGLGDCNGEQCVGMMLLSLVVILVVILVVSYHSGKFGLLPAC